WIVVRVGTPLAITTPLTATSVAHAALHLPDAGGALATVMQFSLVLTWSAPLTVLLVVLGISRWRALDPFARDCALSVLLTLAVRAFMAPQGAGWGYRYLYADLGRLALVAAVGA